MFAAWKAPKLQPWAMVQGWLFLLAISGSTSFALDWLSIGRFGALREKSHFIVCH
jgi:hypothetical protein